MSDNRNVIAQFAQRLRNLDPKIYEGFIQALDAYSWEVTVAVTKARQDEILNQQGRAQALLQLLDIVRDCDRWAGHPRN